MQNSPSLSILLQNRQDISESSSVFQNDLNKIKIQRFEHFNTLTVGSLNIKSINKKFEMTAKTITNFDIFILGIKKWTQLSLICNL